MKLSSEILYDYAMSFVGTPYRWGGSNPMTGFDCSGFVLELLKASGVVPHKYDATSQEVYNLGKPAIVDKPGFGRLLFFGEDSSKITHIAFALNEHQMLEAGGGTSETNSLDVAEKQNAFIKVRPIAYRQNLVGIVQPKYPWE